MLMTVDTYIQTTFHFSLKSAKVIAYFELSKNNNFNFLLFGKTDLDWLTP